MLRVRKCQLMGCENTWTQSLRSATLSRPDEATDFFWPCRKGASITRKETAFDHEMSWKASIRIALIQYSNRSGAWAVVTLRPGSDFGRIMNTFLIGKQEGYPAHHQISAMECSNSTKNWATSMKRRRNDRKCYCYNCVFRNWVQFVELRSSS